MPKKKNDKNTDKVAPQPTPISASSVAEIESLREQVKELENKVEHYKALDKEGDELNEKRLAELDKKDELIRTLQIQVNELKKRNNVLKDKVEETLAELIEVKKSLDTHLTQPWYKRVFNKKN